MRRPQLVSSLLALLALVTVSSSAFAAQSGFDQTASPLTVASESASVGGYPDGDIEVHAAQYYGGYYPYYGYGYSWPYYGYGYSYPYYNSYYSYPYYSYPYSYSYPYYSSYYPYYSSSYMYPYYGYGYGYGMGYGSPYYRYPWYWY
jgi:hypothetical protein